MNNVNITHTNVSGHRILYDANSHVQVTLENRISSLFDMASWYVLASGKVANLVTDDIEKVTVYGRPDGSETEIQIHIKPSRINFGTEHLDHILEMTGAQKIEIGFRNRRVQVKFTFDNTD